MQIATSFAGSIHRPQVLLAGFFGRGNCGDEALLQCAYEAVCDEFDVIVSVDEHGAFPGFWDWYPYNCSQIVHQCNFGIIDESKLLAGVLVGGGGLPAGFCIGQAMQARLYGVPTALMGTDCMDATNPLKSEDALRHTYGAYDIVAPRHQSGVDALQSLGVSSLHGADWALRLQTDQAPIEHLRGRTFITIREFPTDQLKPDFFRAVVEFVQQLRDFGHTPCFLPFCTEDSWFLKAQGLEYLAEMHEDWSNPRRMQQIIGVGRLMLSIGRLHPLVFAANVAVPVAYVRPMQVEDIAVRAYDKKVNAMCQELGIERYDDQRLFWERIQANAIPAANSHSRANSLRRLDLATEHVKQRFRSFAATRLLTSP